MKLLLSLLLPLSVMAAPTNPFGSGHPKVDDIQKINDHKTLQTAVTAYRFWYPSVSYSRVQDEMRKHGVMPNDSLAYMKSAPVNTLFTPNADTPYGFTALNLKNGPMVIEVPSGPFIGLIIDQHQRWITDMGLPSKEKDKGGKYLLLPPGYEKDVPSGFDDVRRADSYAVYPAFRILPENGDADAALDKLREIKIYPLNEPSQKLGHMNVTKKKFDLSLHPIEDNLGYWEALKKIIDEEPMVNEFIPMYGLLQQLGIEKGKPFEPNERMKKILSQAAKNGKAEMLVSAFGSTRPDRMVWADRQWEWASLVSKNGDFRTESGAIDLEARERWFAQAIAASPAMFSREEGAGSLYWLGIKDSMGQYLDGGKTYKLTVPGPVPANLFWSVTVYDNETRSFIVTDQDRAAIRSLFELKNMKTASYDLYFGPKAPKGMKNQWVKTVPGKGWFAYFRIYGPKAEAFNGSWKPNDFEEVAPEKLKQAQEESP